MLRSKQGRTQTWLPTQVQYGMDTSDIDPAKWKPFGALVDQLEVDKARQSTKAELKVSVGSPAARE